MTLSLHVRILLAATFILVAFLGLTGLVLDRAFRDSARSALEDRLQDQMYNLLGAIEPSDNKIIIPGELPDSRMSLVTSGLFAQYSQVDDSDHWHSLSATGLKFTFSQFPDVGEQVFETTTTKHGFQYYVISRGVKFDYRDSSTPLYILRIGEELGGFNPQINNFRNSLFAWLGGAALLLLIAQGMILRWGLKPLRQVAIDLQNIEAGIAENLTGKYPKELQGLTNNLNALINSTRNHITRYRDALGNLAHSIKTPLAVLQNAVQADHNREHDAFSNLAEEQVQRMTQIVDYQLKRAATAGNTSLNTSIPIEPIAARIMNSMDKVYTDKAINAELVITTDIRFFGDEGDLYEILGNTIDNAYKWAKSKVTLEITDFGKNKLLIELHDDGPGISDEIKQRVLQRGQRADPTISGQGIGLAVVHEIVLIYGGEILIKDSKLGGALIEIKI
ncbi:MAG: ATP-binding protein [Gammaproteobacteria bacterium]